MLEIHIELFNVLDLKFGPHAKLALSQSTTGSSKWTAVNVATCVWCRRSCPVSVRHTCGGICARLAYFGHWNVGNKTDRVLTLLCSSLFQVCSLYCPNLGICHMRNLDSLPLFEKQTSAKKKNKKKKTARDTHTISKSCLSYIDQVYRLCCWLYIPRVWASYLHVIWTLVFETYVWYIMVEWFALMLSLIHISEPTRR